MTPEELWDNHHPERKLPGTAEPEDGKCGAKLRSTELTELGLVRYCGNKKGKGTDHVGLGNCKFHLGNTKTHVQAAAREGAEIELRTISEQLGEAPGLGNPEVEAWILMGKMKQWSLILEDKTTELNNLLATTDEAGVEHVRAIIELLERAWERYQKGLEFMLKFEIRKRVLALEEHQARLVGQAFMSIILDQQMKLSESQVDMARTLFADQMREIGAALEPTWAVGVTIDAEEVTD